MVGLFQIEGNYLSQFFNKIYNNCQWEGHENDLHCSFLFSAQYVSIALIFLCFLHSMSPLPSVMQSWEVPKVSFSLRWIELLECHLFALMICLVVVREHM